MNIWSLPETADVNGREYRINADFRDVLNIVSRLNNEEEAEEIRLYVALALFYDEFENMPEADYGAAVLAMFDFINCGEPQDSRPAAKIIDWEQDCSMIIADVNKVAGCEIRALPFCHWWTFISWFNSIGEGQLSTVVSIREKRRKGKKLNDFEADFYRNNREKVDFKTTYTAADDAVLKQWLGG